MDSKLLSCVCGAFNTSHTPLLTSELLEKLEINPLGPAVRGTLDPGRNFNEASRSFAIFLHTLR